MAEKLCNFTDGALVQHQEWNGKESTITRKLEDGKLVVECVMNNVTCHLGSGTRQGPREWESHDINMVVGKQPHILEMCWAERPPHYTPPRSIIHLVHSGGLNASTSGYRKSHQYSMRTHGRQIFPATPSCCSDALRFVFASKALQRLLCAQECSSPCLSCRERKPDVCAQPLSPLSRCLDTLNGAAAQS
ncbi:hypothetical protein GH733_007832 [Mirounga leonina]|nr:hypothetical protein GH733_007832 [Mirounga leonina]